MLTTLNFSNEYAGLSTDEKPIKGISNGSVYREMDTQKIYRFDEDNMAWVEQSQGGGGGGYPEPTGTKALTYTANGTYTENVKDVAEAEIKVNVPEPSFGTYTYQINMQSKPPGTYRIRARDLGWDGFDEFIIVLEA